MDIGTLQGAIKLITDGVPRSHPDGRNLVTTEFETKLSARLNGNGMSGAGSMALHPVVGSLLSLL